MTDTDTTEQTQFERSEDFVSSYANSVIYESTAWDLKLIFGQLDRATTPGLVKQHLAVTIPWPQAKLALFWLRLHVEGAEAQVGAKIPIRKDLLPAEVPPLPPEQEQDPEVKEFYELYRKIRAEFIAGL